MCMFAGTVIPPHDLDLLVFDNQLQNKEAEASSHRESSYTETPSTPKVRSES